MAKPTSVLKIVLLAPFVVLVFIVALPLAVLGSIVDIPFAKKRAKYLNEVIQTDWLPRQKYIYLSFHEGHALAPFAENELLPKYGKHIIYDKWSSDKNEWSENEPDSYRRVTTILQDFAGDFDDESNLLVAVLSPKKKYLSKTRGNILYFVDEGGGTVDLEGKAMKPEAAQRRITGAIEIALAQWQSKQNN